MKSKPWIAKIKKSSKGVSVSLKHGNKNIVWSAKGYNSVANAKRQCRKSFPGCLFEK